MESVSEVKQAPWSWETEEAASHGEHLALSGPSPVGSEGRYTGSVDSQRSELASGRLCPLTEETVPGRTFDRHVVAGLRPWM